MGELWSEHLARWLRNEIHSPDDYARPLIVGLLFLAAAGVVVLTGL